MDAAAAKPRAVDHYPLLLRAVCECAAVVCHCAGHGLAPPLEPEIYAALVDELARTFAAKAAEMLYERAASLCDARLRLELVDLAIRLSYPLVAPAWPVPTHAQRRELACAYCETALRMHVAANLATPVEMARIGARLPETRARIYEMLRAELRREETSVQHLMAAVGAAIGTAVVRAKSYTFVCGCCGQPEEPCREGRAAAPGPRGSGRRVHGAHDAAPEAAPAEAEAEDARVLAPPADIDAASSAVQREVVHFFSAVSARHDAAVAAAAAADAAAASSIDALTRRAVAAGVRRIVSQRAPGRSEAVATAAVAHVLGRALALPRADVAFEDYARTLFGLRSVELMLALGWGTPLGACPCGCGREPPSAAATSATAAPVATAA